MLIRKAPACTGIRTMMMKNAVLCFPHTWCKHTPPQISPAQPPLFYLKTPPSSASVCGKRFLSLSLSVQTTRPHSRSRSTNARFHIRTCYSAPSLDDASFSPFSDDDVPPICATVSRGTSRSRFVVVGPSDMPHLYKLGNKTGSY